MLLGWPHWLAHFDTCIDRRVLLSRCWQTQPVVVAMQSVCHADSVCLSRRQQCADQLDALGRNAQLPELRKLGIAACRGLRM